MIIKRFLPAIIAICFMLSSSGCSASTEADTYEEITINLHVQTYFYGHVKIYLNTNKVFDDTVWPQPRLGYSALAGTYTPAFLKVKARAGENHLLIWYKDSYLGSSSFEADESTNLGVGLDHNGEVIIRVQEQPFLYH